MRTTFVLRSAVQTDVSDFIHCKRWRWLPSHRLRWLSVHTPDLYSEVEGSSPVFGTRQAILSTASLAWAFHTNQPRGTGPSWPWFGMLTGMRYVRSINRGSIPHRTNNSFSSPQCPKRLTFRNKLLPSSSGYKRSEDGKSSLHPNYGIYPRNRTASQPSGTWSSHSPRWETQNNFHTPKWSGVMTVLSLFGTAGILSDRFVILWFILWY